jgi:hypothetical protein
MQLSNSVCGAVERIMLTLFSVRIVVYGLEVPVSYRTIIIEELQRTF